MTFYQIYRMYIFETMNLRSMKNVASVKPVEERSEEVNKYIRELQELFNELSKWSGRGCPIERIGVIIDIFTYIDENIEKVKNEVCLKTLHDSFRNKVKVTMYDIAVGSSSANTVILENLKKLATLCVSILSKLG